MGKPTGPGHTEHRTSPKSLLLYNFDIDGDQLKPEHQTFLLKEVVPILKGGGSVSLVGLASRTGSYSHNLDLSKRRAKNTLAFLRKSVPSGFAARHVTGFGESKAEQEGYADRTEMQRFRSVVVFTSTTPKPPPTPKKNIVTPEKPKPAGAKDRTLVVLLENGGIKVDVAGILLKLKKKLPATVSKLLPDSVLKKAGDYIKEQIRKKTDFILESADLLLNRFNSAVPKKYGKVLILRDGKASYTQLRDTLIDQTGRGKIIDLFVLTHGGTDSISVKGGISTSKIKKIKTENGDKPISLRVVYMMNCVGSSLNQAWLDIGAQASSGSLRNNYLPEPSMYLFWTNWKGGQTFEKAVMNSYKTTISMMDEIIKSIPIIGDDLAAGIDVKNQDFVKDSKPVIKGRGSLTSTSPRLPAPAGTR